MFICLFIHGGLGLIIGNSQLHDNSPNAWDSTGFSVLIYDRGWTGYANLHKMNVCDQCVTLIRILFFYSEMGTNYAVFSDAFTAKEEDKRVLHNKMI